MYVIKTKAEFDSAHFLKGYEGKCANIHGHRWKVCIEVGAEDVEKAGPYRGMVVDFGVLRSDLKSEADIYDHTLIIERGSISEEARKVFTGEGFRLSEVDFRPTAECLAKHFFDTMKDKGYKVLRVEVYETPDNVAVYYE